MDGALTSGCALRYTAGVSPKARGGRHKREAARDEVKVFGVNAVHALADNRIDDIIRVLLLEAQIKPFSRLLEWCAANKRAYHVVSEEELARFAASLHHEGICVLARARPTPSAERAIAELIATKGPQVVLVLEGVQNPNNVGAILRTAAHFGSTLVLHQGEAQSSTAIARTAEGGAEFVDLIPTRDVNANLEALRAGRFEVVATDGAAKKSLYDVKLPERMVLLLGAERTGLSRAAQAAADAIIAIPGTGWVESLNVSVASAIVLAEHWRQHPPQASS